MYHVFRQAPGHSLLVPSPHHVTQVISAVTRYVLNITSDQVSMLWPTCAIKTSSPFGSFKGAIFNYGRGGGKD